MHRKEIVCCPGSSGCSTNGLSPAVAPCLYLFTVYYFPPLSGPSSVLSAASHKYSRSERRLASECWVQRQLLPAPHPQETESRARLLSPVTVQVPDCLTPSRLPCAWVSPVCLLQASVYLGLPRVSPPGFCVLGSPPVCLLQALLVSVLSPLETRPGVCPGFTSCAAAVSENRAAPGPRVPPLKSLFLLQASFRPLLICSQRTWVSPKCISYALRSV